ncbi:MAG: hypothetical protein KDC79_10710 [Cyclobacteriaceae bacterium]|nr:hypothetical protein [Cyclobacteriaceae bacterium]
MQPGQIKNALFSLLGWRTDRKIIVIESDDWGSIRMPSKEVYASLKKAGLDLDSGDSYRYNKYDTLANAEDFSVLFDTLLRFKDSRGKSAVLTAVSVVANPDFETIRDSDFLEYHYESIEQTIERYTGGKDAFAMWKTGIEQNVFIPQFHGREHLNVPVWMRALQENNQQAKLAFDQGVWGFNNMHAEGISFQAAFNPSTVSEVEYHKEVIKDGTRLFKKLFDYDASFFVPPNGQLSNSLERTLTDCGIKFTANAKMQFESIGLGRTKRSLHYLGQRSRRGQTYLIRNCFFEPSSEGKNWVESCLKEIEFAFKWKQPAIIGSHRVNYVGGLDIKNRDSGIGQLSDLLSSVTKRWPEIEFMTSAELGEIILGNKELNQ